MYIYIYTYIHTYITLHYITLQTYIHTYMCMCMHTHTCVCVTYISISLLCVCILRCFIYHIPYNMYIYNYVYIYMWYVPQLEMTLGPQAVQGPVLDDDSLWEWQLWERKEVINHGRHGSLAKITWWLGLTWLVGDVPMDHNGPIGREYRLVNVHNLTNKTPLTFSWSTIPKWGFRDAANCKRMSFFEKIKTCNFVDPNEKWQLRVPQFRIAKLFERQFEVNSLGIRGKLSPIFAWLLELGSSVSSRDSHC